MTGSDQEGKRRSRLQAPQRNRYFVGRVLEAASFTLEQEYWLARERRLNRHLFGSGVVSGLDVTSVHDREAWGLRIGPGVALDQWGREIVVPQQHELLPIVLTDERGNPAEGRSDPLPSRLVVSLCYGEYLADLVSAAGPDPARGNAEHSTAATRVETYAICVREGEAQPVSTACPEELLGVLRRGNLQDALCALAEAADAPLADDPRVVLANVSVAGDGTLDVEQCAARSVVPTNKVLLGLVACLAERVERAASPHARDAGWMRHGWSVLKRARERAMIRS